jgi:hypothetical protein
VKALSKNNSNVPSNFCFQKQEPEKDIKAIWEDHEVPREEEVEDPNETRLRPRSDMNTTAVEVPDFFITDMIFSTSRMSPPKMYF